jgi:putative aldouronate transport system substrate-binding protein
MEKGKKDSSFGCQQIIKGEFLMVTKRLTLIMAFLLIFALILTGCGKVTPSDNTTTSGSTTTASATIASTPQVPKVPDKITVFYQTAGQALPPNFSHKDNDYFKEICKIANVEVTELNVPEYADTKTKFNLMISSGEIPDVVHYADNSAMTKLGKEGAFLEMSSIIQNSAIINKLYSKVMINAMKADDGKIYTLRSLPTEDSWHMAVRYDLLTELGYTKLPTTLTEWVDAMKKLKLKYPDSIPYTTMGMDNYQHFIFRPYGCDMGINWQYAGGKVRNVFENPAIKDAILFGKQLFADGLLEKEFATNKLQDYNNKRITRNALFSAINLGGYGNAIDLYAKGNINKAIIVPAPWPVINDSIDPYSRYAIPTIVGGHNISINSKTKQKDACVRFIETLYSDKVREMFVYGREGIEFTVSSGKKVINPEKQNETGWRALYGMMYSYNPLDKTKLKCETNILAMTNINAAQKENYKTTFFNYFDELYKNDYGKVQYNPMSIITLSPEALAMSTEAIALQKSLILKAIMSEISIDEFMKQAADLVKKYQSVTDDYNKKLPAAKTLLGLQ